MDLLEDTTATMDHGYFVDLFVRSSNATAIAMYEKVRQAPGGSPNQWVPLRRLLLNNAAWTIIIPATAAASAVLLYSQLLSEHILFLLAVWVHHLPSSLRLLQ